MEAVNEVRYANGVTLHAKTADGWPVTDTDGAELLFASMPAFMSWCRTNHSWPMV